MADRTWSKDVADKRIRSSLANVKNLVVYDYVRNTSLEGLSNSVAYRVDGVHLYVDILNIGDMLLTNDFEGETVHRRTLMFLNLHFRAVRRILLEVDAIHVDFHNQRLHAVFPKPYGDEAGRVDKAIATAQLIIDVLNQTGEAGVDGGDPSPPAKARVGIDSGVALAVNNGRRGNREPLFLGPPANHAAKRACGGDLAGIFVTNEARDAASIERVRSVDSSQLTLAQIEASQVRAKLTVTADEIVKQWNGELEDHPISKFQFHAHTPPYKYLDMEVLTAANSRRQDAVSIYADIDGFTKYVGDRADDDKGSKDVARVLHVLRAELDSVLYVDFAGRKVRFIGDCVHGVLVEGTAANTDAGETAKNALMCAAAMRSSFALAIDILKTEGLDTGSLGLAIGLEYGPVAITRLGTKGELIRCCISRAVLASEAEQLGCLGSETAMGPTLKKSAPIALAALFNADRRCRGFTYEKAVDVLSPTKKTESSTNRLVRPAAIASVAGFDFPARAATPSKTPPGFA